MSVRFRLKNHLVKILKVSHEEVNMLIHEKKVRVNEQLGKVNMLIHDFDKIMVNGICVQEPKLYVYYLYNKPEGIECTMNQAIDHNLMNALTLTEKVFPVGRLDKASKGLLLLTNHGALFDAIARNDQQKEKEYVVQVNKELTDEFIYAMQEGVVIMGKQTRKAKVKKISDTIFNIVLNEGMNRQIRRMCYKYGYEVISLQRTRIMNLKLGLLKEGELRSLTHHEVSALRHELFQLTHKAIK